MSLVDIKKYLMQVKISSLSSICIYFNAEPDTLRQMLGHWIRKGCIRQCMKTPSCGLRCVKCSPTITEIYEWVGN
jgi:putative ferrous iron transport protein C